MEVVSSDGSVTQIEPGQTRELGRADGLNSSDKTISRRQISFLVPPLPQNKESRVQFEILGRNPVYVSKDDEVKIFRRSEKGEMENGDMFCVSAKNPVWYTLRKIENGGQSVRQNDLESVLAQNLESGFAFKDVEGLQQEGADISDIDPAKEFGFVVIGHEFDSYPDKIIRDIKNWDWFLDESEKDSDDDDDDEEDNGKKRKASRRSRKRKKGTGNDDDDDEWTGESEDENVLINKSKNDKKPKYVTRSKDRGKRSKKDTIKSKSVLGSKTREVEDEEDEDDDDAEDDETLGGFIVDDENLEDEEEEIGDEDEEEEEEELVDEDDVDE